MGNESHRFPELESPEASRASSSRRRVLFLVTGLSPQIVTETLHALCVGRPEPFIPTEIHLLTTQEGARRARLLLLEKGHFQQFCEDYDLPELKDAFRPRNIEVARDARGRPLSDISTEADAAMVADAIMRRIRRLTADPDCAIHASVAGGRKTMGVALALVMTLLGRPRDALSHVLVSPPFESHPEFFYPPPRPKVLLTGHPPRQEPVSTDEARISLAEIPFLRLRGLIDPALLAGAGGWRELIARAQQMLRPPCIEIETRPPRARLNDRDLPLTPVNLAFLLMLARRARRGEPTFCPADGAPDMALSKDMLKAMDALGMDGETHRDTRRTLAGGMEKTFFERRKSAANKAMREALGPGPAAACLIGRRRDPATGRYRHDLPLDAAQITIREG